ncbi:hypothetical protein ABT001_18200 [Streptomyces sp. NPDC002793]|uniref:hypothetical protein n=1 Tax=Streptomyces sp. NPDC002793 TaxID=3154432 RepID=UPI0033213E76
MPVLPCGRHLGAGRAIHTERLSRATRQGVTRLGAGVFPLPQQRRYPLAEPDRE